MVVNRLPSVSADYQGCVQDSSGCTTASAVTEKAHKGLSCPAPSAVAEKAHMGLSCPAASIVAEKVHMGLSCPVASAVTEQAHMGFAVPASYICCLCRCGLSRFALGLSFLHSCLSSAFQLIFSCPLWKPVYSCCFQ